MPPQPSGAPIASALWKSASKRTSLFTMYQTIGNSSIISGSAMSSASSSEAEWFTRLEPVRLAEEQRRRPDGKNEAGSFTGNQLSTGVPDLEKMRGCPNYQ